MDGQRMRERQMNLLCSRVFKVDLLSTLYDIAKMVEYLYSKCNSKCNEHFFVQNPFSKLFYFVCPI